MKGLEELKEGISAFRKAIITSIIAAVLPAMSFSWMHVINKLRRLEIGEYPEEPAEIILARLREMRPNVIREGLVVFCALFLILLIINLLYWFKRYYNINLVKELVSKAFKKS